MEAGAEAGPKTHACDDYSVGHYEVESWELKVENLVEMHGAQGYVINEVRWWR